MVDSPQNGGSNRSVTSTHPINAFTRCKYPAVGIRQEISESRSWRWRATWRNRGTDKETSDGTVEDRAAIELAVIGIGR
ncbi:MAG: hypothetical protein AAGA40_06115 [Cyanobacteria bacterium P01_E01_bin.45]